MKLPAEDHAPGMCGLLNKSMLGTRDAAPSWECEYAEILEERGLRGGIALPCIFEDKACTIRVAVHGGDFTALGHAKDLAENQPEVRGQVQRKDRPGS